MGYSDYKYYKPTIWDKFVIEGLGWSSLILLFAGIWINDFRWRLIFSALILFLIAMVDVAILQDKNNKAKNDANHAKGDEDGA